MGRHAARGRGAGRHFQKGAVVRHCDGEPGRRPSGLTDVRRACGAAAPAGKWVRPVLVRVRFASGQGYDADMKIERPSPTEYAAWYESYVARVQDADVLVAFERQPAEIGRALAAVSEEQAGFRYAPDKWTVREVLGHLIDCERIFGYRALCIARGDVTPLPGFDENAYAAHAGHDRYRLTELLSEFEVLRGSHVSMLAHLDSGAFLRVGTANDHPVSVRALTFIMVGHARHHLAILATRYGIGAGA